MNLFVSFALGFALLVFLFYALVSINHAARFRYLGPRTITVTLLFVALCSILLAIEVALYLSLVLN
jgi:hypothetical protein